MSIAIHSPRGTHHAAAVASMSRRHEAARDTETPERSAEAKAPKGRHALMNALSDALATLGAAAGASGETGAAVGAATSTLKTPEQKEALHAFAHELFNALRPTSDSTGKGHHGRGFAWGRTSLGDLAERIEALAQKLGRAAAPAAGTAPPPASGAATTPVSTGGTSATTGTTGAPGAAATTGTSATAVTGSTTGPTGTTSTTGAGAAPATPTTPTTPAAPTATAQIPTMTSAPAATSDDSPLLAAFRRLAASLQGSAPDAGTAAAGSPADALAALLHRMAQALVPDGRTEPPAAGSLVDVTA